MTNNEETYLNNAIKNIMHQKDGIIFLLWLMEITKHSKNISTDKIEMQWFTNGRQDIGNKIFEKMFNVDETEATKILNEHLKKIFKINQEKKNV